MAIPLAAALHEIFPNVCFQITGEDYESLVWPAGEGTKPTEAELRHYADGRDYPICPVEDHLNPGEGFCSAYTEWIKRNAHASRGFGCQSFGSPTGEI